MRAYEIAVFHRSIHRMMYNFLNRAIMRVTRREKSEQNHIWKE